MRSSSWAEDISWSTVFYYTLILFATIYYYITTCNTFIPVGVPCVGKTVGRCVVGTDFSILGLVFSVRC